MCHCSWLSLPIVFKHRTGLGAAVPMRNDTGTTALAPGPGLGDASSMMHKKPSRHETLAAPHANAQAGRARIWVGRAAAVGGRPALALPGLPAPAALRAAEDALLVTSARASGPRPRPWPRPRAGTRGRAGGRALPAACAAGARMGGAEQRRRLLRPHLQAGAAGRAADGRAPALVQAAARVRGAGAGGAAQRWRRAGPAAAAALPARHPAAAAAGAWRRRGRARARRGCCARAAAHLWRLPRGGGPEGWRWGRGGEGEKGTGTGRGRGRMWRSCPMCPPHPPPAWTAPPRPAPPCSNRCRVPNCAHSACPTQRHPHHTNSKPRFHAPLRSLSCDGRRRTDAASFILRKQQRRGGGAGDALALPAPTPPHTHTPSPPPTTTHIPPTPHPRRPSVRPPLSSRFPITPPCLQLISRTSEHVPPGDVVRHIIGTYGQQDFGGFRSVDR